MTSRCTYVHEHRSPGAPPRLRRLSRTASTLSRTRIRSNPTKQLVKVLTTPTMLGTTRGPHAVHPAGQTACRYTGCSPTMTGLASRNGKSPVLGSRGRGFKSRRPDAGQKANPRFSVRLLTYWGPRSTVCGAFWRTLTAVAGRFPVGAGPIERLNRSGDSDRGRHRQIRAHRPFPPATTASCPR